MAIDLACGASVFVKIVELPRMPEEEAIATLRHTERDSAPFPLRDALVDVWISDLPERDGWMKVLMAAMEKEEAERKSRLAEGHNLKLGGISVTAAAIGALLSHSRMIDTTRPTLFMNVDANSAGIHIFERGAPIFTREIPRETSRLKELAKNADDERALDALLAEVSRSVDYFLRSRRSANISQAFITGSLSTINDLDLKLSASVGLPFKVYDPFEDFIVPDAGVEASGVAAAMPIGLALDGAKTINLSNTGKRGRFIQSLIGWKTLLPVFIVVLLASFAHQSLKSSIADLDRRIGRETLEIDSLEKSLKKERELKTELAAMKNKNALLELRLDASPENVREFPWWVGVLENLGANMPGDIALSRLHMDFSPGKNENGGIAVVSLEGISRGAANERIANLEKLLHSLKSSGEFDTVSLKKAKTKKSKEHKAGLLFFEISVKLKKNAS